MTLVCCIVDPFVSSTALCEGLHASGIEPIAILTPQINIPISEINRRFNKNAFKKVIHITSGSPSDIEYIQQELKGSTLLGVIAGNERSCAITDCLAEKLAPFYANSSETSILRMNKFEMQNALQKASLPAIKQIYFDNASLDNDQKAKISNLHFPLILKPINQSGSFGVTKCNDLASLEVTLKNLIGTKSSYGSLVGHCVAQEFLTGEEYFVDTVSLQGQHKIINIYRYDKVSYQGHPILRFFQNVASNSPEGTACIDFVKKALSAVHLNYGMGHTELFLTDQGPRLVEINPRISGLHGIAVYLTQFVTGTNQVESLIQSLSHPQEFLSTTKSLPLSLRHGRVINLYSWKPFKLTKFLESKIKSLPSFKKSILLKNFGEFIHPPKELKDVVALVVLVHEDNEQVIKDYNTLLELEKNNVIFQ